MTKLSAAEKRYLKAQREAMEFADRAHRRQMLGNVATSFFQSLAANRPLQVGSMLAAAKIGQGVNAALKGDRQWYERISDPITDAALTVGGIAYLTNSDGGVSVAYDIPDVESPRGGDAFGQAGGWFLPPAAAVASRAPRRR